MAWHCSRCTPRGHTGGHFAYLIGERVCTGDALQTEGCGRTDFQNGNAADLYRNVTEKLFALPDDCLVYPAHEYQHRCLSSIAQEKKRNPQLGDAKTLEQFERTMAELRLPTWLIDCAVPRNRQCGVCPTDLPEEMQAYCVRMTDSPQG